MSYSIEVFEENAKYPYDESTAETEREARRIAARMLRRRSLRGASTWERWQGGIVYQFGPRTENNGYDFVVISLD